MGVCKIEKTRYEFTSSGILCTNHINCRDQLCVNLDTGELIQNKSVHVRVRGRPEWLQYLAAIIHLLICSGADSCCNLNV